jgi:tetratricopeptide (TPR) repeat protein
MPRGSLDVIPVVRLYERMGLADRGLALLDPVIDLHRADAQYLSLLNARSWNRGLANADLDRALKDANTLVRRAGPMPSYLDTRALIELRRKDYTAAIADESAALEKTPRMAAALYVRGLARIASGDAAGGTTDVAAARAAQPGIDQRYAAYGLAAPGAARSSTNTDDDDRD